MPPVERYKCRVCGYIYSPLRGEPHNGIPAGTKFDDLPESYICPICGMQGKGKIGKWGFEEWVPTRWVCSVCGYVCPVCALDPKIKVQFGKVFKNGFEPLEL
jgi:rubredoxin